MRPVMIGDLLAAARVLRAQPPAARDAVIASLIAEADLADRWRGHTGRAHPRFGNGSLMAAALARRPAAEPFLSDPEWLDALGRVIVALRIRAKSACVFGEQ